MGKSNAPRSKKLPVPFQTVDQIRQMHREQDALDPSERTCLCCAPTAASNPPDAVVPALQFPEKLEVEEEPELSAFPTLRPRKPTGSKKAAPFKAKMLTERRIVIIKAFLTKTLKYPHNYDPIGSPKWIKMMTQLLCDKRIVTKDILAWLSTPRFQPLVDQIDLVRQVPEARRTCLCCVPAPVAPQQPWCSAVGLFPVASKQVEMEMDVKAESPVPQPVAKEVQDEESLECWDISLNMAKVCVSAVPAESSEPMMPQLEQPIQFELSPDFLVELNQVDEPDEEGTLPQASSRAPSLSPEYYADWMYSSSSFFEPLALEPGSESSGQLVEHLDSNSDLNDVVLAMINKAGQQLGASWDFNEAVKWEIILHLCHVIKLLLRNSN